MIKLLRFNEKWKVCIENETLEFDTKEDFDKTLKELVNIKEKYEPKKEESSLPNVNEVVKGVMDMFPKPKK